MRTASIDPSALTPEFMDRFWRKTAPDGGCLCWTGRLDRDGYGRVDAGEVRGRLAHRVSWVASTGTDIPPGMVVDHLCRNTRCVRPSHLDIVSQGENVKRGESFSAKHSAKTRCPRGHVLTGTNLVPSALRQGSRSCLTCANERRKARGDAIAEAVRLTGMTYRAYVSEYGSGRAAAEQVILRMNGDGQ